MDNLQITPTGVIETKPTAHILLNKPAFKEEFDFVYNEVLAQVEKSIVHLGWKVPNDTDMELLVNEITTSIRNDYKQLRTEEISMCFAKGIRGEYGDFMGMSIVTFEKFIIGYLNSQYRINLGKTLPRPEEKATPKELTRQDRIDFALKAFQAFKEKGFYNDLGNIVYAFLDSEKLIPFTAKEKFETLEIARQEEYQRLSNPLSSAEASKFNKQIEELISGNESIIPKSKRIALNTYFKRLVDNHFELSFNQSETSNAIRGEH